MAETFLYLTTIGRKTGLPRQIEIWYVAHGDCYYLCAEHRDDAQWVKNLRQQPQVTFYVAEREQVVPIRNGFARPLDPQIDTELHREVSLLFDARYEWSDGLLVEICPIT